MLIVDIIFPFSMIFVQSGIYKIIIPLLMLSSVKITEDDYIFLLYGYYVASAILIITTKQYEWCLTLLTHIHLTQILINNGELLNISYDRIIKLILSLFMYGITMRNDNLIMFSLLMCIIKTSMSAFLHI